MELLLQAFCLDIDGETEWNLESLSELEYRGQVDVVDDARSVGQAVSSQDGSLAYERNVKRYRVARDCSGEIAVLSDDEKRDNEPLLPSCGIVE